jgi:hypothetical protein
VSKRSVPGNIGAAAIIAGHTLPTRKTMSKQRSTDAHPAGHGAPCGLLLLRIGLPASLATAGIVLLLIGRAAIAIVLLGTALIAALVDFFARMTNESDLDREREEQARATFMRTGRWPGRRR